jgi:hypothetical protein
MTYSHVFNIITDEKEVIEVLTKAIQANKESTKYKKCKKDLAYSFGAAAFNHKKPRIPANDKEFIDQFMNGTKVGECLPFIKAWLKGWDESNLKIKIG